jgi:hypothetical protein
VEDELDSRPRQPAGGALTPAEEAFYGWAYSVAELRTFHSERVRKMPLSGLDLSILVGSCAGTRRSGWTCGGG